MLRNPKQLRIALLTFVCVLCGASDSRILLAQHGSVTVDWKAELAKAKAGIEKNPKSAFWHNQAGMAYNALGDVEKTGKELKLASTLGVRDEVDKAIERVAKQNDSTRHQR